MGEPLRPHAKFARGDAHASVEGTSSASRPPTAACDRAQRRVPAWSVLAVCCTAQFMVVLDVSIVNVALPQMRADLQLSPAGQQWVINAYTLTFAGLLLLGGRAGDLFGRRRMFLIGISSFTVFSLAGGLAQNSDGLSQHEPCRESGAPSWRRPR